MDDFRLAADPARINAALCEARRLRNEVMRDLFMAIFDGRLLVCLGLKRKPRSDDRRQGDDLPRGTATQG